MWTIPKHFSIDENVSSNRSACFGKTMTGDVCVPEAIYLKPGELYAGRHSARVTTVLGSCVAVTMYDRRRHAAAMCHAIQSNCRSEAVNCRTVCREKFKSVRCAINEMVRQMAQMGASHDDIEIKMFEGAALLWEQRGRDRGKSVGDLNVEEARRVLYEYGFRIRVMKVGGTVGRKIIFNTCDGAVFLKRIESIRVKEMFPDAACCG